MQPPCLRAIHFLTRANVIWPAYRLVIIYILWFVAWVWTASVRVARLETKIFMSLVPGVFSVADQTFSYSRIRQLS